MGVASLVLGIIALVLSFIPIINVISLYILGPLGLILGIVAVCLSKKMGKSKGPSIAGIVCSTLSIITVFLVYACVDKAVESLVDEDKNSVSRELEKAFNDFDREVKNSSRSARKAQSDYDEWDY